MLEQLGVDKERLIFDPGIGFGKYAYQDLALICNANRFKSLDLPLLVGHSRKSFHELITSKPASQRDLESAILSIELSKLGVDYLRVHNVEFHARALKTQQQIDSVRARDYISRISGAIC